MTPGLHPVRLGALMEAAVTACRLDLSGKVVLTEAATGPYVVTPVLAAMAGARRVVAVTRSTRHGSVAQVNEATRDLARRAGVGHRLEIVDGKRREDVAAADIVTNSGHVRPIDAETIGWMKPTAVVPLMFEAWELQEERGDLDLAALRARGIAVAGTNERHPAVDVFSYLGVLALKVLLDAGIATYRSRVVVLCDNDFGDYLLRTLKACGADVTSFRSLQDAWQVRKPDAVVVALKPGPEDRLDAEDAVLLAERWPGTVLAQVWGDVDREACLRTGVPCAPPVAPSRGHMAVLPSDVGPEPVVRLQAGGLKVAEVLLRPDAERSEFDRGFLDAL